MATIRIAIILVAVFAVVSYGVSGQSPAEAPADAPAADCLTNLLNMSDCLTYVEAGSNLTAPEKACCPELAGLVESNPICLCQLVGHTNSFGIKIDLNKALKLPSLCRVTTPPVSLCSVVGVPAGGPTANDDSLPPGGSAATPSPGNNGALRITDSSQIALLLGLAIAFLLTFF